MGSGSIITLLTNNKDLSISGVIVHNPFIKMSEEEPIKFSLKDWIISYLLPKDFEQFKMSNWFSAHELGRGENHLYNTYNDRMVVPITGLKMIKLLLKIEWILYK